MTIDIRANVTCSLGPLISGSISDDYIQGNGLIKTKGSCELDGIFTPQSGAIVTFSYTRNGITRKVPRTLRVLSSFADPFRKTTKVELGCKLTWMANVSPAPSVDGKAAATSGRQQQCVNGYLEYPADTTRVIPVSAYEVAKTCLQKLGIAGSPSLLTNRFFVENFDLSSGYVSVLSDLLQSEGFIGYLSDNEVLQIASLAAEGGKGPYVDQGSLIDLGPIGIGDLPGDSAFVRFNTLRLKKADDAKPEETKRRSWEEEETASSPEEVVVRYTDNKTGDPVDVYYYYVPYTRTVTQYGKDDSFDEASCSLYQRQAPNLGDLPIRRTTTERVLLAQAAGNYCSEVLSAGHKPQGYLIAYTKKVEEYKYDTKGELIETTQETWEPDFKWVGGLNIDFVYPIPGNESKTEFIEVYTDLVLTEKIVTRYENLYAPQPVGLFLKFGETYEPEILGQKVSTQRYQNWTITQQGQQAVASFNDNAPFETKDECVNWLIRNQNHMVLVDSQVITNRGRSMAAGQVRPSQAELISVENGDRSESVANVAFAAGGMSSQRAVEFSMPYTPDDYYDPSGRIIGSDVAGKALRYGRLQNRLLLGNRNGVGIQIPVDKMPQSPFAPIYLGDKKLTVQYRANAASWAFSRDGIVASLDALFWGVAGGDGTPWVPVAPGITTFPPLPVPDADGNVDVPTVVPPWNETVPLVGRTRTLLVVKDYAYAIGGTTETAALVTRTNLVVGYRLAADAGSFAFTGTAQPIKLRAGVGSFVLSGLPAGSLGSRIWRVNGATFNVMGQDANKMRTYAPLTADVASFALDGKPAGKFKGTAISAEAGSFLLSGKDAAKTRVFTLPAAAGSFTAAGIDAALTYMSPVFSYVSYTGNAAARSITGVGFQPSMVWISNTGGTLTHDLTVFDVQRGAGRFIATHAIGREYVDAQTLTSFDSNGFSLGTSSTTNNNAGSAGYDAYCWKGLGSSSSNTSGTVTSSVRVSPAAGFSVFTYTGNSAENATVGHGLSSAPEWVFIQQRTSGFNFAAQCHSSLLSGGRNWALNSTAAASSSTQYIKAVGSSTITLSSDNAVNSSSMTYVGFAFTSVPGVSKLGLATGNGSGVLRVDVGFCPRLLIVKTYIGTGNWLLCRRTNNTTGYVTQTNMNSVVANAVSTQIQITSTGFSIDAGGNGNVSGSTESIWYMAYA